MTEHERPRELWIEQALGGHAMVQGKPPWTTRPLRFVEAEPVEREREEMLDVLEGLLVKKRLSPDAADAGVDFLRKYGRLLA